jgi:hypothetical protein
MATYCCVLWNGDKIVASACMVDYPGGCPQGWVPFQVNDCNACAIFPSWDQVSAVLEQTDPGSSAYVQSTQVTSEPPFADQFSTQASTDAS